MNYESVCRAVKDIARKIDNKLRTPATGICYLTVPFLESYLMYNRGKELLHSGPFNTYLDGMVIGMSAIKGMGYSFIVGSMLGESGQEHCLLPVLMLGTFISPPLVSIFAYKLGNRAARLERKNGDESDLYQPLQASSLLELIMDNKENQIAEETKREDGETTSAKDSRVSTVPKYSRIKK